MPQSGNVLLGDSLDLFAVGLQSALYPSSRLHSPTAHVQHLHTREAVLLHRLGQDRNERLRVLRDRRVVYVSPSTPTRTEQRQDRQRLGERRLHHRAHHLRAQLVVYASRAAVAATTTRSIWYLSISSFTSCSFARFVASETSSRVSTRFPTVTPACTLSVNSSHAWMS